jgi:hypothetical protein
MLQSSLKPLELLGVMAHLYNFSTPEAEAGGFEAILGYSVRHCFHKTKPKQTTTTTLGVS